LTSKYTKLFRIDGERTVAEGFLSSLVYLIPEFGDLPELYLTGMNLKKYQHQIKLFRLIPLLEKALS
jgi:hypothetical protein